MVLDVTAKDLQGVQIFGETKTFNMIGYPEADRKGQPTLDNWLIRSWEDKAVQPGKTTHAFPLTIPAGVGEIEVQASLTYDAWASGPYGPNAPAADRKPCQSCHMPKSDGQAAVVPGTTIPSRPVSSHLFPGWHDPAALQQAAGLTLATRTAAGAMELVVTIDNKAGHRLPDT